jgi:hypothetical protein
MRGVAVVCVISVLAICALSVEARLNAAQPTQPQPAPGTESPPNFQNPPANPQNPGNPETAPNRMPYESRPVPGPNAFRRDVRPPAAPGEFPGEPRGMSRQPGVPPNRPIQSVFLVPQGLSMPPAQLFELLGYGSAPGVPLTPQTSFDLAYKCYSRGLYADAIAFAHHGLTMCNDARLYLLEGVCEMRLGRTADAEKTATNFRNALADRQFFGMEAAQERINGPMRVRFEDMVEYQSTGR